MSSQAMLRHRIKRKWASAPVRSLFSPTSFIYHTCPMPHFLFLFFNSDTCYCMGYGSVLLFFSLLIGPSRGAGGRVTYSHKSPDQ